MFRIATLISLAITISGTKESLGQGDTCATFEITNPIILGNKNLVHVELDSLDLFFSKKEAKKYFRQFDNVKFPMNKALGTRQVAAGNAGDGSTEGIRKSIVLLYLHRAPETLQAVGMAPNKSFTLYSCFYKKATCWFDIHLLDTETQEYLFEGKGTDGCCGPNPRFL